MPSAENSSDNLVVQEKLGHMNAEFQLLSGEFEVVLLVDSSESIASRKYVT